LTLISEETEGSESEGGNKKGKEEAKTRW